LCGSSFLTHQTGEGGEIFPVREKILGMRELPVIACSLTAGELPERRRRWRALLDGRLVERSEIPGGVRLELADGDGVVQELQELAALERECCAFASFEVRTVGERVRLDVTSSEAGVEAVRELFTAGS
jgi:hypothetical protein